MPMLTHILPRAERWAADIRTCEPESVGGICDRLGGRLAAGYEATGTWANRQRNNTMLHCLIAMVVNERVTERVI